MKNNELAGFVWTILIFLAPAGMFVMWESKKYDEIIKIILPLIVTLWFIIAAIWG